MDVARDGLALYEFQDTELHKPKPKTPAQALAMAQEYYEEWFPAAMKRFDLAKIAIERGYTKQAAFDLHQTVERLYHCVLTVLTLYSPKSHKLTFLRSQAERIAPQLIEAWPRDSRFAKRCFTRLDRAYVGARYSPAYEITGEELAWLVDRVKALQEAVAAICAERLDGPGAGASSS